MFDRRDLALKSSVGELMRGTGGAPRPMATAPLHLGKYRRQGSASRLKKQRSTHVHSLGLLRPLDVIRF